MEELFVLVFGVVLYIAMLSYLWLTKDKDYRAPKVKDVPYRKHKMPEGFRFW